MRQITLVQIGAGTIGGAVIEQAIAHRAQWRETLGVDVRLGAIVTRAGAVVSATGGPLSDEVALGLVHGRRQGTIATALTGAAIDVIAPEAAVDRLADAGPVVVAECGAGTAMVPVLVGALAQGGAAVLANKAPLALPWADPNGACLWREAGPRGRVRYEATCGAGLPVISTLRGLLDTGDTVTGIQGTVSGTFGTIFSDIAAGQPFGAAVRDAAARGYTEPDPRDDLSGLDVARKALILSRTIGGTHDLDELTVESLVPATLAGPDIDVPCFLERIGERDDAIRHRAEAAAANGATLKYLVTIRDGDVPTVGLVPVSQSGVLGAMHGPENIVVVHTRRYDDYPLAIFGPGAGAAVTGAGVLNDILSVARVIT